MQGVSKGARHGDVGERLDFVWQSGDCQVCCCYMPFVAQEVSVMLEEQESGPLLATTR